MTGSPIRADVGPCAGALAVGARPIRVEGRGGLTTAALGERNGTTAMAPVGRPDGTAAVVLGALAAAVGVPVLAWCGALEALWKGDPGDQVGVAEGVGAFVGVGVAEGVGENVGDGLVCAFATSACEDTAIASVMNATKRQAISFTSG